MLVLAGAILAVSADKSPQEKYIAKYSATAVREMYRTGVPASITLAQGLLESRYGQSELAAKGNNHFGIKCHDWKGKTMKVDDDRRNECFRVYGSADESFRDHSDFLRYRDRYKFLFENELTDYKAWAHGLKKAGYATDPQYASKLIKIIEDYNLSQYDRMTVGDAVALDGIEEPAPEPEAVAAGEKAPKQKAGKVRAKHRKRRKTADATEYRDEVFKEIPASPLSLEEPKRLTEAAREEFHFPLSREMYSRNGVPFLYSVEGETWTSIAASNHLFLRELLKFNDMQEETRLEPGTIVYLQAKKNQAAKGLDKFIVDDEPISLHDICQRFGVKQASVEKMNSFPSGYVPREGDTIYLRKH